jgi:hypothetical protein
MKKILCVVAEQNNKIYRSQLSLFSTMKPQTATTTITTTTNPSEKRRIISFEETPSSSFGSKDDGDEENDSFPKIQIGKPEEFEPCDVIARVKRRKIDLRAIYSKFQRETFAEPTTTVISVSSVPATGSVTATVHVQRESYINSISDEDDDSTQANEQGHSLSPNKSKAIQNKTSENSFNNHTLNEIESTLQLEYIVDELDFDSTQQKT